MDIQSFVTTACIELGMPKLKVEIIETELPNAFANQLANTIHVTRGLLDLLTPNEVLAVLTHEIAHIHHKHLHARLAISSGRLVLTGINLFLPIPIWKKLLIELGLSVAAMTTEMVLAHKQEYEADAMAYRYHLNQSLGSALRKLEDAHQSQMRSLGAPAFMSIVGRLTHPSTEERIKRLTGSIIDGE